MSFAAYFETIKFLEGLSNIPQQKDYMRDRNQPELYLKRMRYFFELIDSPHEHNFKFIHIAGTSGKGSVTTMLHECLYAAGEKVVSFTSPFVTTSIEKIKFNDQYIAPEELVEIVQELKPYITRAYLESPYGGPSYFEIWFAIKLKYALKKKAKWIVSEVGMGGKFDPGVLVKNTVATALTNVNYDHTEILGKTLKKIGREKAGIMKRGVPFFTTETRPHLLKMFKALAIKQGVKFVSIKASRHQIIKSAQLGLDCNGMNTALVYAIARHLKIPEPAIEKGIARARLPARFETMQHNPRVILDGAHNVSKMQCTATNLERIRFKKLILVLGISANKDVEEVSRTIVPQADYIIVTRHGLPFRKSAHPKDLVELVNKYKKKGVRIEVYVDAQDAFDCAMKVAKKDDCILVTGSFFLAGSLRKRWYSEERILKTRQSF